LVGLFYGKSLFNLALCKSFNPTECGNSKNTTRNGGSLDWGRETQNKNQCEEAESLE